MTKKELKIEQYHSIRPTRYPIVEHMQVDQEVSRERSIYNLSLVITLRSRSESDASRLLLSFSKVRNLRLNPENAEISFSLLTIVPVIDGWEEVSFKVFNDEQDIEFSFFCDDFEANLVK